MKKIFLFLSISLLISLSFCNSDSNNPILQIDSTKTEKISININNVIDFTSDGNYFYFLTKNEIITVNNNGEIKDRKNQNNITGLCFDNYSSMNKITIDKNIISEKGDSLKINLNQNSKDSNTQTKFLTLNNGKYFTCLFYGGINRCTWSDKIIYLEQDNIQSLNANHFVFTVGVPGGIYSKENSLYYLHKTGMPTDTNFKDVIGTLSIYNISGKKITREIILPFRSPIGIYVDDNGYYYTYSNYTKEIIKFNE